MDPGAWAGCVIRAIGGVYVLVSDAKWDKTKAVLEELNDLLLEAPDNIPVKVLERIRCFLNYVTQTYRPLIPYLNGLHLTLDGWRPNRDAEGWRSKISEKTPHPDPPTHVKAKPRLFDDVQALRRLCDSEKPPWRRVRAKKSASVFYGFGDASGAAFGATLQKAGDPEHGVTYQYGQWTTTISEEESSNWRELANLVEFLESEGSTGKLNEAEVFMFTDNSTAENAFFKGTSKSKKLCSLILRLRLLEMSTSMILHVVHVSGRRMIAQGTDGLSRGDHSTGVMRGNDMVEFIPLHLSASDRSPQVATWVKSVLEGLPYKILSPEDWFLPHANPEIHVWVPPPAAADAAVERLRISRHMRPNTMHLFIVPRLMTGRWRKQLGKASDFYFRLMDEDTWDLEKQYEPLLIYCCLPFLPHRPLLQERESLGLRFLGIMSVDSMQTESDTNYRSILCKLFGQAWSLRAL